MQALHTYNVGMNTRTKTKSKSNPKAIQYTIRGVSEALDQAIRQRAVLEGKSLNEILIAILEHGLGPEGTPKKYRDLDFIIGTWVEDPAFDEAIAAQDQIDEELWR